MLHPQAQALIDLLVAHGLPPTHTLTPAEARAFYRGRRALTQPAPPDVAELRELRLPGPAGELAARAYRPLGARPEAVLPVLVYFHGGGWVIGDLDTHDTLCRELANASGCAVVSVDYRLAPEHPFPAAFDDAREHAAQDVGIDDVTFEGDDLLDHDRPSLSGSQGRWDVGRRGSGHGPGDDAWATPASAGRRQVAPDTATPALRQAGSCGHEA